MLAEKRDQKILPMDERCCAASCSFCYCKIRLKNRNIPVEKLNDSKGGGVRRGSRSNPVKSSLSDVDKIDAFVTLVEGGRNRNQLIIVGNLQTVCPHMHS